ncbi:MAG: cupin domain-containing protein [Pacificimonas sp.]|nr:cupin domain-containing protein [Pacificimonas sp.]
MTAEEVIRRLGLRAHPEGGWYRETWRAEAAAGERGAVTAIYFLLGAGERSHWHRVDATELWLWHAGSPLRLDLAERDDGPAASIRLGPDLTADEEPQRIVPKDCWQAAVSLGAWTLVSCIVAPAFSFDGFTLAPPGWAPGSPAGGA